MGKVGSLQVYLLVFYIYYSHRRPFGMQTRLSASNFYLLCVYSPIPWVMFKQTPNISIRYWGRTEPRMKTKTLNMFNTNYLGVMLHPYLLYPNN